MAEGHTGGGCDAERKEGLGLGLKYRCKGQCPQSPTFLMSLYVGSHAFLIIGFGETFKTQAIIVIVLNLYGIIWFAFYLSS